MIKRLVFGFGPPKCGQDTTGISLQREHGWRHVSMRRSLLELDKAYDGVFDIADSLRLGAVISDDLLIAALTARIAHSVRWDDGKNIFFQGLFGGTAFARFALDYASHFAREVEVVEFQLDEERAFRRLGVAQGADNTRDMLRAHDTLMDFQRRATDFRKAITVAVKVVKKGIVYRSIDANHPVDHVMRQIIKPREPLLE